MEICSQELFHIKKNTKTKEEKKHGKLLFCDAIGSREIGQRTDFDKWILFQ